MGNDIRWAVREMLEALFPDESLKTKRGAFLAAIDMAVMRLAIAELVEKGLVSEEMTRWHFAVNERAAGVGRALYGAELWCVPPERADELMKLTNEGWPGYTGPPYETDTTD